MPSALVFSVAPPLPARHDLGGHAGGTTGEIGALVSTSSPGTLTGVTFSAGLSCSNGALPRAPRCGGAADALAYLRDEMMLVAMLLHEAHDCNQTLVQATRPDVEAQRDLLHLRTRVESMLDLVAEVMPIADRLAERATPYRRRVPEARRFA